MIQVLNPEKLTDEITQDMRAWWGSTHVDYIHTKGRFVLVGPGPVIQSGSLQEGTHLWVTRLATFGIQAKAVNR